MNATVIGPTLPALAEQTHTRLGSLGLLFLAGAAGYALGTMFGGHVFDRVRGHPVLGTAQLAVAGLIALVPALPWFGLLLCVWAGKGFAEGLINTGANTLLVWTHREKVGPYMNGLHFFFGLGAFCAPLVVAQWVGVSGGYRWAYWMLAGFAALAGLRVLTLSGSPLPLHARGTKATGEDRVRAHYPLVAAAALFLFFYVGGEVAFGGWLYTYAVTLGLAGPAWAAYLTSGFWLSFTVGRLIAIPTATRFAPKRIVLTASFGCLAMLVLMAVMPGSDVALWAAALGLGLFMAPIWPAGFTLAGQSLKLTARASSAILIGDCVGGMALPWLMGEAIEKAGPRMMVPLVFGSMACSLLAFVGMVRLCSHGKRASQSERRLEEPICPSL
jgi:MFS transporter, FHS family, Na+ dependent glucose transporter 1